MPQVTAVHLGSEPDATFTARLLDREVTVTRRGAGGDPHRGVALVREAAASGVDVIVLDGLPLKLRLENATVDSSLASEFRAAAGPTPLVDGSGVRDSLERWAVKLATNRDPIIFGYKHVLMAPGLNHGGLSGALAEQTPTIRYADSAILFDLPLAIPGQRVLKQVMRIGKDRLASLSYTQLSPAPGESTPRDDRDFQWADVIAGDMALIRRYAPYKLRGKSIVVEALTDDDIAELRARGAEKVIVTMPGLGTDAPRASAAVVEGVLAALSPAGAKPSAETYLNLLADLEWQPEIIELQHADEQVNRFAFVIHPLSVKYIYKHPILKYFKWMPDRAMEQMVAQIPPMYVSRIIGGQSPTTGQKIEGILITLGSTPRMMMTRPAGWTYRKLIHASRLGERMGARIMGLGAFTSVVGDAGVTVAQKSDIGITSGNSLTVAATLEAAKQAVGKMGGRIDEGRVVVIGATGSIGSVCARLLAEWLGDRGEVVLVAPRPERLIELKRRIEDETPGARVSIGTSPDAFVGDADLIVTTTSAMNKKVVNIDKVKPGCVICDVARPPDVKEEDAARRPDVLVIESGEINIPGDIDFGFDIGLPPKTAYACLAETALLAMEGKFDDYTIGRDIDTERVKEIYRLFKKHEFQLAGLRSFDRYLSDEDIARKRALADEMRAKQTTAS